jgi:hypothetical protein
MDSIICHWPLIICGAGEVTFIHWPPARFVHDCNVNPADASGHVITMFPPPIDGNTTGLFVLNIWFGPIAYVAAASQGESAALYMLNSSN